MSYCIYLRKSRADLEAEARGEGESLARHEAALLALAKRQKLPVTKIFREIVSGESIDARPEMQALLREVEAGLWDGVLVMEVERLARGDTVDQGVIFRAFQYSHTLIVTPLKTYDPTNEFDQEYFEFGLFMSRREYKVINRRMQRGRVASVNEGKWPANAAPYGYRRVKLKTEKGWTLEPDEHADVVRSIFAWYTDPVEPLGIYLIVRRLNESGIPSPSGRAWAAPTIYGLLANCAYAGFVVWGRRADKREIVDGRVVITRPRADNYIKVPGLHPALVSRETFDAAQRRRAESYHSKPGPRDMPISNPLAGLVYCAVCGRAMQRRPYPGEKAPSLLCPYTSCGCVSSRLDVVEGAILDGLRSLLSDAEIRQPPAAVLSQQASLSAEIAALEKELSSVEAQISRAFDLVEQGVYTTEIFLQRSRALTQKKDELTLALDDRRQHLAQLSASLRSNEELAPRIRRVLDVYPDATVQEQNDLLKSVLSRVWYKKTVRLTRDPSSADDLTVSLVPLLPPLSPDK